MGRDATTGGGGSGGAGRGWAAPRWVRLAMAALLLFPLLVLHRHFDAHHGFLGMIFFGRNFEQKWLPEVRALQPPADSARGYDGQLYAQLVLDPALRRPELAAALDVPSYRARRIALPALASGLGLGRTGWSLQAYALLNLPFWAALAWGVVRYTGARRWRDAALAASLLAGTGSLVSVERALTDLPAAVLCAFAVLFRGGAGWAQGVSLAAAALTKETSLLCFPAAGWPADGGPRGWARAVVQWILMAAPLALWMAYVACRLPHGPVAGAGAFAWPGAALAGKLTGAVAGLADLARGLPRHLLLSRIFEVLAPFSLVVQAAHFLVRPRPRDPAWRMGVGFVALMLVLGPQIWIEQQAYTRTLLPMTFAFNLQLHDGGTPRGYAAWCCAGNAGMVWMALTLLA